MQSNLSNIEHYKTYITEYLSTLGFEKEEAIIFATLTEKGPLSILELSRITNIERTKIYGIVEKLKQQSLLTVTGDYKKKYVKACNFSTLNLIIKQKISILQNLSTGFPLLKQYLAFFKNENNPTDVKLYNGKSAIKQVLWNELNCKSKIIYSFTYRHIGEVIGIKFTKTLEKEYRARRFKIYDLQSSEFAKSITSKLYEGIVTVKAKYIDPKILDIQIALDIWDDTVTIFNWHKGEVFAVEIQNEKFADFMKQIHKIVWKQASTKSSKLTNEK